jgi:hypothetical protein
MCSRKRSTRRERAPQEFGPYDGRTVSLSGAGASQIERQGRCAGARFPWWSLWMIWPLVALVKWTVPLYAGAAAALVGSLGMALNTLVALALIVAGLVLIRRS